MLHLQLQSHTLKRSIPASSKILALTSTKRFNSSGPGASSFGDPAFEDQVLLDKLFQKNKPSSRKFLYETGSFLARQEKSNLQEEHKFTWLDEKLTKLKSTPVNFNYYLRSIKELKNANQLPYKFGSNQLVSNDAKMDKLLKNILWEFNAPIRFAFGYGSKVFSQGAQSDLSNAQMDMMFAVSYPDHWHSLNINQNPDHYSSLKHLGSNFIAKVEEFGAGVYFNPFVKMNFKKTKAVEGGENLELKYGVTSVNNMMDDLTNWRTMYIAGRLHKPTAIIRNSPAMSLLNQYNLTNAIKLSLLLLNKHKVKESELYLKIAELSYMESI
ncbi:unnamed protein product [Ambrosiozyma monospora]|uniref:Unnamed protein product n=1 Tax=Ambrosiozyma monospora TaxID=43982 RepID=A0ACB5SRY2_AMBMO|nr:unnamed protein product [Ambrosiozyma monospora]